MGDVTPDSGRLQPRRSDSGSMTRYGFRWGPVEVTRACLLRDDRRVVQIKAGGKTLDVYVSAAGRSVRVFSEGREWTP